jgi:hypothetical protein
MEEALPKFNSIWIRCGLNTCIEMIIHALASRDCLSLYCTCTDDEDTMIWDGGQACL